MRSILQLVNYATSCWVIAIAENSNQNLCGGHCNSTWRQSGVTMVPVLADGA